MIKVFTHHTSIIRKTNAPLPGVWRPPAESGVPYAPDAALRSNSVGVTSARVSYPPVEYPYGVGGVRGDARLAVLVGDACAATAAIAAARRSRADCAAENFCAPSEKKPPDLKGESAVVAGVAYLRAIERENQRIYI